jgi:hypothetical protein
MEAGRRSLVARRAVAWTIAGVAVGCLAALWWLTQVQVRLQRSPITVTAATDGSIWVGSAGVLHRLDRSGTAQDRITLSELRLPDGLSHLHAISADDVLLTAGERNRLYRCTPSKRVCRPADGGYAEYFGGFNLAVWVGANADGSRVVVADNGAHRVAVLDEHGALLAHAGQSRFRYPAQPVWQGDRSIWLAGADKRTIERFEFLGDSLSPTSAVVLTPGDDRLLTRRDWPMALAPVGDGAWWAIVQYDMRRPGGLLRFREGAGFDREARFTDDVDLTSVAPLGDGVVVADMSGPRLWLVSSDGSDVRAFGSGTFVEELRATGWAIKRAAAWQRVLTWGLILTPLLGIGLLLVMGERMPAPPRVTAAGAWPAPLGRVTLNLLPRPPWLRWTELGTLFLMPLLLLAALGLYGETGFWDRSTTSLKLLLALCVLAALAAAGLTIWATRRNLMQHLEVEDGQVRWMWGTRLIAEAPLKRCWTDGRSVMIDDKRLLLFYGRRPLFDPEAISRHVLSAIPEHQRVPNVQLELHVLRRAWRRRPWRTLMFSAFVLLLVLLALVPPSMFPSAWIETLRQALR